MNTKSVILDLPESVTDKYLKRLERKVYGFE